MNPMPKNAAFLVGHRKKAILWAQEMLKSNCLILDTETTGLHDGEIVQIAIIDSMGLQLYHSYVKPIDGIPEEATRIHKITEAMVQDMPTWAQQTDTIADLLTGRNVCVYNAIYDRKMLHFSAEHAGLPKVEWKVISHWHCVMEQYAAFYGEWNAYHQSFRWQSLGSASAQCGYFPKNEQWHTALGDCQITLAVMRAMAYADDNRSS